MGRVGRRVWEGYARLPESVQRQTDRMIRIGAGMAKRIRPLREDSERKGRAWVEAQKRRLGLSKKRKR